MNDAFQKIDNIIENYDNIILVGHKDPDLDSLGSCLGLYEILKKIKKKPYLFLNNKIEKYNSNIINSLELLDSESKKIDTINSDLLKKLNGDVLVIIADVNIRERLECPDLVDNYKYIVLDHHIKNKNYLKKSIYTFNDSNLSSVCEFITMYAEYKKIKFSELISTILLAGIEIDTNGFNLKTSAQTYLSASILMSMGADSILKQELLKESKEEYIKRANYIRNSFMLTDCVAMCIITTQTTSVDLAMISEELLTFENVEASFTIGKIDKNLIGVSARSLGEIDVLKIIKKLGGGGHRSNAATQIQNTSINNVKKELINLLK